jgi:hypothetical protein
MTKAEEKAAELYPYAATGTIHWAQQVCRQEGFLSGANWKASQHEWVKCSERFPTYEDGDIECLVDVARWSSYEKRWVRVAAMHWANLQMYPDFIWCRRNTNYPEPPKTEI